MENYNSFEENDDMPDNNFKVLVRVRPLLPREILNGGCFSIVKISPDFL